MLGNSYRGAIYQKAELHKARNKQFATAYSGATAAENEFRTLEDYFVETAEYLRTARGEIPDRGGP